MLVSITIWCYISMISIVIGHFFLKRICLVMKCDTDRFSNMNKWMAGTVILTVYAQIFSLFAGVSFVAQILLLLLTIVAFALDRKDYCVKKGQLKKKVFSLEIFVFAGIVLVSAFFTSRGIQHTDTGIYHAMAIHYIEKYGVIKGLGNLMGNFAYNSSWLCYTALFSFSFLGGQSFHTTNGLMMAVMCIYAIAGLIRFKQHDKHYADACRVAILFYTVVICVVAMSPATDSPSMYMVIYVLLRWCELIEDKTSNAVQRGLVVMTIVYTITIKVSAAMLIVLAISPIISLIRKKEWKKIGLFVVAGFAIAAPFLIRNVIISGWLLYPFSAIDLFDVKWKIPKQYVDIDSIQIKVYGRKTYENHLISQSIKEWFPIWWNESFSYDRMLIIAQVTAFCLMAITFIKRMLFQKKIYWELELVNLTCFIGVLSWLFTAPFIRYDLGFLLVIPFLAIAEIIGEEKLSIYQMAAVCSVVVIVTCMAPYWNHYVMDSLLFVKQHATDPYYISPKEYEEREYSSYEVSGITFYQAENGDQISYFAFPGSGKNHQDSFGLLGNTIRDGFYAK